MMEVVFVSFPLWVMIFMTGMFSFRKLYVSDITAKISSRSKMCNSTKVEDKERRGKRKQLPTAISSFYRS
jgi:hypothetical protein